MVVGSVAWFRPGPSGTAHRLWVWHQSQKRSQSGHSSGLSAPYPTPSEVDHQAPQVQRVDWTPPKMSHTQPVCTTKPLHLLEWLTPTPEHPQANHPEEAAHATSVLKESKVIMAPPLRNEPDRALASGLRRPPPSGLNLPARFSLWTLHRPQMASSLTQQSFRLSHTVD